MIVEAQITVSPECRSMLGRLGALDNQPEMAIAKKQIGVVALQDEQREFRERSVASTTPWVPLSDGTVILRQGGPKIYDESDVSAKRDSLKLLRETNRMYASLTPSAPGNVLDVLPGAVRIGTAVSYAVTQQEGGPAVFKFGPEQEARFERNVSKTLRGMRKPRALKSGAKRVWKAAGKTTPWNPFYFKWRAIFRQMNGQTYHVPARPFVIAPKPEWVSKYVHLVEAAIRRISGK